MEGWNKRTRVVKEGGEEGGGCWRKWKDGGREKADEGGGEKVGEEVVAGGANGRMEGCNKRTRRW